MINYIVKTVITLLLLGSALILLSGDVEPVLKSAAGLSFLVAGVYMLVISSNVSTGVNIKNLLSFHEKVLYNSESARQDAVALHKLHTSDIMELHRDYKSSSVKNVFLLEFLATKLIEIEEQKYHDLLSGIERGAKPLLLEGKVIAELPNGNRVSLIKEQGEYLYAHRYGKLPDVEFAEYREVE